MPASQVGLPTVLASHRFADVTIDKFTDSEEMESAANATGSVPDAKSSVLAEVISPERAAELRRLIAETGASESRFCAYLKIRDLAELPASRFEAALAALNRKRGGNNHTDQGGQS